MARILIVEDDTLMAQMMRGLLAPDRYDIEVTGDGLAAVQLLRDRPADLLLLDVNVPGCDGIEVCRLVREHEDEAHRTTIVMITGRRDTASKLLAFSVGADDYLVKPFDVYELRSRVARWVESRNEHAGMVMRRRRDAIAEIVTAICHEVNNPLTAAIIGVDLITSRRDLPEAAAQDLETVRTSLERIEEVIRALQSVEDRTVTYHGRTQMIDIQASAGSAPNGERPPSER